MQQFMFIVQISKAYVEIEAIDKLERNIMSHWIKLI